jgi:hypothetical protein
MAYVLPQVTVFQEFNITPAAAAAPRAAHITGGHAKLFRYSNSDEKIIINLGEYDSVEDTAYSWPERPVGSQVDFGFVKLYAEDALLEYYNNPVSADGLVAPVSGYKNRVRDANTSFKTNGTYARSAVLYDRDVQIGDYAVVRGSYSGTEYSVETSVRGFVGDTVAAVVNPTELYGASNKSTQTLSVASTLLTPELINAVTVDPDASAYDGRESGDISETYTVEVITGSVDSDFPTARLRVTSASGRDNVASVTPATAGSATAIGTRGFTVTFDNHNTNSTSSLASENGISESDFVEGQKWRFVVNQAFTAPVITGSGTYTGTQDTTYIIEVTKGGVYAASPEVTVTTTTGYDVSGPRIIAAANVSYAIGNYGVVASFNQTALCKGDKYYIIVTAAKAGAMKTLILADDLPENLLLASDLDLRLYIRKNVEIERQLVADAPNVAYTTSDTEITIQSGIMLNDDSWTDGGVKLPLELKGGTLFVEYRAWLPDYVNAFDSITDASELSSMLGQASPDNPLYWAVYLAIQNANGQPVFFSAVADPNDTDSWINVLEILDGQDQIYNLVPLTTNATVLGAWKAHVESQSAPEVGNFRAAVFGIDVPSVKAIVNSSKSSDSATVLAKLSDDPNTSGTQYTLLFVPANNAKFVTNGVRAGDKVRFLYSTDGFGNETYSEFVIDEVLSEGSVRLATGHTSSITIGQKAEVWRTLNRNDRVLETSAQVGQYSNRRVVAIANSTVGLGGAVFPGYFAAAAVAGLRSGVLPQQGLTHVSLSGVDDVGALVSGLNGSQLNQIAGAGGWIIAKDNTGAIYNRHGVTTDSTDLNTREEMIRVNVDSISYQYRSVYEPYIGKANVTEDLLIILKSLFESVTLALKSNGTTSTGPQLIDGVVADIRQHALFKDRVVIEANLTVPYPLNNIELKLVV